MSRQKSPKVPPQRTRRTRDWRPAFLKAFAGCGTPLAAAEAVPVTIRSVNRERANNPDFAAEYEQSRLAGVALFEKEAVRRATQGLRKYKFYEGRPIMIPDPSGATEEIEDPDKPGEKKTVLTWVPYYELEFSDTLLLALLKRHFPEQYRENSKIEHNGPGGGPLLGGALEAALLKVYGNGENAEKSGV